MAPNDLLWIPLKKTSDIDVVKPLRNLIASTYSSADSPVNVNEQLNEFMKLRKAAINADKTEAGFNAIANYYDQIHSLEQKIPSHEVQIPFKWKDAFDRGSIFGGKISLTVPSMAYEKVCILFNLGAACACVAADQNLDHEEGMQRALKKLTLASGIFLHLKEIVVGMIQQDPTPDLEPETLGVLSDLMLAQAQEMIVLKAVSDKMKDTIIAKLCSQCEDLYANAMRSMQREGVRNIWDGSWLPTVSGKQAIYNGMAQYHQSRACNASKNIGEEIARLEYAKTLFAAGLERGANPELCNGKEWLRRTDSHLTTAKKDNDFIYHERVPETKNLAVVAKAVVAKPTAPLPARIGTSTTELFDALCPVAIHQAMAAYAVRKKEIVDREMQKMRGATSLLNEMLTGMNLPAAIEDTSGSEVPASVIEKATAVKDAGGLEALLKLIGDLPESLQRNTEILDECERYLKEEKDSDSQLRAQFKEKWTRTASADLTATFSTNAAKYRTIINNAKQADTVVKEKLDTHRAGIEILGKGPSGLKGAIPAGGAAVQGSPTVTKLKSLMEDVETIKAERQVIESEILAAKADVKPLFFEAFKANGVISEQDISTESLARLFGPLQTQLAESCSRQESLITEVQQNHERFVSETGGGGGANARDEKMKSLAAAHDSFVELKGNLQEGTKFYNDLTQLLLTFQNKVSDFCFARKCEKEELLKDMTSNMATLNLADSPAAPAHHAPGQEPNRPPRKADAPARPPQPAVNPYAGAPQQQPIEPVRAAPAAPAPGAAAPPPAMAPPAANPYGGVPYPAPGMVPGYPAYTPMPQGFNPYAAAAPAYPGFPPAGYPPQYPPGQYPPGQYPGYPPAPAGYPPAYAPQPGQPGAPPAQWQQPPPPQ